VIATSAPVRVVDVPCPACGGRDDELVFEGREHEYDDTTNQPFRVARCSACGLVRLNPRPDISELRRIYPPDYYAYHLADRNRSAGGHRVGVLGERVKKALYQRRLAAVVRRAALGDGPIRLLDVGCADGRLLDWYRSSREGQRIETHGIDIDERATTIARSRGHRVVVGRFEDDTELEASSFQLILASHVIEHVADPRRFASRAAELLAPGGLFVVATPNIDSPDARCFGRHWGGCHVPRHWTFFDSRTLGDLAHSVGLEVERVEYQPNPVFWVWTMHSLLDDRSPRLADRLFPPVGVFRPSVQSFVLLSAFTIVDLALRVMTGKTASMSVEMRKP
jgi:SAM-dependent methyltransferase